MFAAKQHSVREHRQLVLNTGPFPQKDGTRVKLASRGYSRRPSRSRIVGNSLKQTAGGDAQSAERPFLDAVCDRTCQKIAAGPRRRFSPVKSLPALSQLSGA